MKVIIGTGYPVSGVINIFRVPVTKYREPASVTSCEAGGFEFVWGLGSDV